MTSTYDVSLAGRVALVTGAARNLPAVIATEFAAAGAAVAINDVAHRNQAEGLAASGSVFSVGKRPHNKGAYRGLASVAFSLSRGLASGFFAVKSMPTML